MSPQITPGDLQDLIVRYAGTDDDTGDAPGGGLGARLDTPFADFGVDSLGLLNVLAQIKARYGVNAPDDELGDPAITPRTLLDKVNGELTAAG